MRLNWFLAQGYNITYHEVLQASQKFYFEHKMIPDTIKLSYNDFMILMSYMPQNITTQEVGKEYKQVLPIPGGFLEVLLLEENQESMGSNLVNGSLGTFFALESNKVDREFEKHVLKA